MMASYISSNNNRFYVAVEPAYGQASAITAQNRIPAVKLATKQQTEKPAGRIRQERGRSSEIQAACAEFQLFAEDVHDGLDRPKAGARIRASVPGLSGVRGDVFARGDRCVRRLSTRLAFAGSHGPISRPSD